MRVLRAWRRPVRGFVLTNSREGLNLIIKQLINPPKQPRVHLPRLRRPKVWFQYDGRPSKEIWLSDKLYAQLIANRFIQELQLTPEVTVRIVRLHEDDEPELYGLRVIGDSEPEIALAKRLHIERSVVAWNVILEIAPLTEPLRNGQWVFDFEPLLQAIHDNVTGDLRPSPRLRARDIVAWFENPETEAVRLAQSQELALQMDPRGLWRFSEHWDLSGTTVSTQAIYPTPNQYPRIIVSFRGNRFRPIWEVALQNYTRQACDKLAKALTPRDPS